MNRTIYISIFGLNLSVINNLKKIISEQVLNQYELKWTHIANKNLQVLLINEDFIDIEHIQNIDKTQVHILKLSKNEGLAGEIHHDTLYLPLNRVDAFNYWLFQRVIPKIFGTQTQSPATIQQIQPQTPQLSYHSIQSAFTTIQNKYSNVQKFVMKDHANILAVFDVQNKNFYLNTDVQSPDFRSFKILPADLDSIVNLKHKFQANDLNHGIWQFVWDYLAQATPEYNKAYQLLHWPQPTIQSERKELLKISAYFSQGCTSQYVQERMNISLQTIHRYLFACDMAQLIKEIPESEALGMQQRETEKQLAGHDTVRGLFSKLRKRLGL